MLKKIVQPHACTLGPAYNEQKDAKETARYKWVLVVTKLFNMVVNDFDAKQSARYSRVLVVTELVLSGTHCNAHLEREHFKKKWQRFYVDCDECVNAWKQYIVR